MAYKALYRVFRPGGFDEVYGQRHITDVLKNQIKTGKPSHAYLFCGPRGTGKTSTAKIFANALNCTDPQDGSPCGKCEICRAFGNDNFVDIIEIDAASNNGVDSVRDIREKATLLPAQGKYKVYIIDEVHMLSQGAFNALLKTLEEPPAHAVFILATTERRKVPATISSRCQRYDFRRLNEQDILARLEYVAEQTGIRCGQDALKLIAKQAEGAMRDALSIMDQCIAGRDALTMADVIETMGIAGSEEMRRLADAVNGEDPSAAMRVLQGMLAEGTSPHNILRDLIVELSGDLASNARDAYRCAGILRGIEALIAAQAGMRYSNVPDAVLTAAVVRATVNTTDVDMDDVGLRLKKLEERVEKLALAKPVRQPSNAGASKKPPEILEPKCESEISSPDSDGAGREEEAGAAGAPVQRKTEEQAQADDDTDAKAKLLELKNGILMKNMALFPSMDAVREMEIAGERLILGVAPDDEPIVAMLASEAHKADVQAVVKEVFGRPMRLEIAREAAAAVEDHSIRNELFELFGEENVDIIE
jgi:DNA polymerase-3 subunit gamma/tau